MMEAPARDGEPEPPPPGGLGAPFAWLLIALGLALRLRTYLACRALRRDEAMLALNLVRRTAWGLLRPLDDDQGAPVGFLLLEKLSVTALGRNEYALRLIPLLAAAASLPLFWVVARRALGDRSALLALGLFAVAEPLVNYSSETKQYSVDLAVALGLMTLATAPRRRPVLLALAGSAAVWLSHPALFVLGGVGLAELAFDRRPAATLAAAACWAVSFLAEDRLFLRDLRNNASLLRFWSAWLMPFPPRSAADLRWFLTTFFDVFKDPVGLTFTGLAAALFLLGVVSLWGGGRRALTLLAAPVVLALAASGLKAYPFSTRLILFTVPSFLIPVAAGVAYAGRGPGRDRRVVAGVLLAVLLLHPAIGAVRNLARPLRAEELMSVLREVARRRRPGDAVYLYFASEPAYRFYSEYADRPVLLGVEPVVGGNGRADRSAYARDVARLRGFGRVWFLFSHALEADERPLLDLLDVAGHRLDSVEAFGASAYLYDLPPGRGP